MKEYMVVNIPGLKEMVATVNVYMQQGWQPIGGIYITQEIQAVPVIKVYAQAMVR